MIDWKTYRVTLNCRDIFEMCVLLSLIDAQPDLTDFMVMYDKRMRYYMQRVKRDRKELARIAKELGKPEESEERKEVLVRE